MTISLILSLKEVFGQDGLNLNTDDSAKDKDRSASKSLWILQSNMSKISQSIRLNDHISLS